MTPETKIDWIILMSKAGWEFVFNEYIMFENEDHELSIRECKLLYYLWLLDERKIPTVNNYTDLLDIAREE